MTVNPGLVERQLAGPPYVLSFDGVPVPAAAVGPLSIRRGRTGSAGSFPPATLTVQLVTAQLPQPRPGYGTAVTVDLSPAALAYLGVVGGDAAARRFTGMVTDADAAPSSAAGEGRQTLIAVGPSRALSSAEVVVPNVGAGWPAESDGARANRLLTLAQADTPGLSIGPAAAGTVTVDAVPFPTEGLPSIQAPGPLLDALAWAGGELHELRTGTLVYRDRSWRATRTQLVELTAAELLAPARFRQNLEGLVTQVRWAALYTPFGGAPFDYTAEVTNTPAHLRYGPHRATLEHAFPRVVGTADTFTGVDEYLHDGAWPLYDLARDLVARRASPRWRIDALSVALAGTASLPAAKALALLRADLGDLLAATGLPRDAPMASALLFYEGATESATRDAWRLALDVTDYADSGPPARFADYPAGSYLPPFDYATGTQPARDLEFTWADYPAALDWWGALAYRPDGPFDRWLDSPADLRWAGYDPARLWTTY